MDEYKNCDTVVHNYLFICISIVTMQSKQLDCLQEEMTLMLLQQRMMEDFADGSLQIGISFNASSPIDDHFFFIKYRGIDKIHILFVL